jgi:lipopolysaccharide/colanic/teichoic acid biosynthesis glycosyltransferase
MNRSQQLVPSKRADLPQPESFSHPPLDPAHDLDGQTASSLSRPALFLAWSNDQASIPDATGTRSAPSPSQPAAVGRRDLGLWLLHNAFARREAWSKLSVELLNIPWPHPRSAGTEYRAAKRICDISGSLIALALLLPLLPLAALLVKLDSTGPVFFRQRRVGVGGREFLLWKFRSMRIDTPPYAPSPNSDLDWRLTRAGRIIRRVSVDELPQLVNVLKGDMSLVGPRPEMPFIVDQYTATERERLTVKPGITGLWQVSPARAHPIHENLQYDLHYIRHQNLVLDGAILLRTIFAVIQGVGAV